ncbi:putative universal ribosomal protein uS15 family protein [Lyophyllum shimeji]|uniref:Universal ribosomal protein uS15 family protein n=1 Tax=Lyophyllum shimeji TaxID=47721 RepID=A0A9P3PY44_LYOSH|nr:putative universal ribosomal protein uS15 family protein [Lyophyllum shimeji]
MLRACWAQTSRTIASSSTQCSTSFHTAAVLHAQVSRQNVARGVKKANQIRKEERWKRAQANRPSVVLGTRPGDEAKWENCLLKKVLVDVEELVSSTELVPTQQGVGTVHLPKQVSFGIGEAEKQLLFGDLPLLSSVRGTDATADLAKSPPQNARIPDNYAHRPTVAALKNQGDDRVVNNQIELQKANAFAKLVDLRNANAAGIAYENRRRIIAAFSTPQNPFDPGRSEVQAALLTYKIRNLWNHLTTFRRDLGNRRGLRKLVHERAKILKYLKRVDQNRYETVLEQLALEPESVEGELVV